MHFAGERTFVTTLKGRGEGLRLHLASHNVRARHDSARGEGADWVELMGTVDAVTVQAILAEHRGRCSRRWCMCRSSWRLVWERHNICTSYPRNRNGLHMRYA